MFILYFLPAGIGGLMKLNSNRYGMLPYEKCLRYGPESLSDTELMAIILRSGTAGSNCIEVAQNLIDSFEGNGILGLKHMSIARLKSIDGIGDVKAVMLKSIGELSSRIFRAGRQHIQAFTDSETVAGYYMEELRHLESERFVLMLLDNRCGLLHESVISVGTVNYTCISAREIFKNALEYGAVYIIMVHNHPSGDPTPSKEDIISTGKIYDAGKLMGIPLIDHIIIGDNRYVSLREKDLLGKD